MNKIIDTTQKQMLRGHILTLCNELKATGAGVPLIHMILKKQNVSCTQNDIAEACYYLQGKELINFKHVRFDELDVERDIAFITSAGIDVLEATKPIDGIILE